MFDPGDTPRLFAVPPGVDFPRAVVSGLTTRFADQPPEALARVTLYVNTRRMQRRIAELFDEGPALLLPRIRLVTDLGRDAGFADLPPAISPLRRRLELAELVARLLDSQPDLAPRAAIYALSDSLAGLMDEMQGEGVDPETIRQLDVSDLSGHWQRSLTFLGAIAGFFEGDDAPDVEARQRRVIERLVAGWDRTPPADPVIVAGSTGSRGATQTLMRAVARLPQGAVILPGFDFEMPAPVWEKLGDALAGEDHPQFRFARLMQALGLTPGDVRRWAAGAPANPARNALMSLALRPAPVTDQWQVEAPGFKGLDEATSEMTLIEAQSPREEAAAIALILRHAAETGTEAALVTPDRTLTRQVTAALDRWRIEPDDSAGRPLPLTPPGRLLRQVAELTGQKLSGADLLALLKHPLVATGSERGEHLRLTRDLELKALRKDMPFPTPAALAHWAAKGDDRTVWTDWLTDVLEKIGQSGTRALDQHVAQTLSLAEALVAGPAAGSAAALWDKPAGREAQRIIGELVSEAPHGGRFSQRDYLDLLASILNRGEVRDPIQPHPRIRIWGTLEARVQGVELIILAGLNEGTWPETPPPDPWMNRKMRDAAGLLLPERRIGLSAHDFQQAIAAPKVVLSRAVRDAENQTVPSRWLNRLINLMSGMSAEGKEALNAMQARGDDWLAMARALDTAKRMSPALRPSPRPPVDARPKRLSVTQITKLVRDPYAIYADKVLGLRPLGPLQQAPDAPLRGSVLHAVMERFIGKAPANESPTDAHQRLMDTARETLESEAPWPAARLLWLAKLGRIAERFLVDEAERRSRGAPVALEVSGELPLAALGFTLVAKADRIDRAPSGALYIYDYKSGHIPTQAEREHIDKQLALEAAMARAGAFRGLAPAKIAEVAYIGLGANPKFDRIAIGDEEIDATLEALAELIGKYLRPVQGYTARRLAQTQRFAGDYDHLSRYGEWDHATPPTPIEVGE